MKQRLDQLLVERELFPSRAKAQAAIMAGLVYIDGQKADKAGTNVGSGARVEVRGAPHPYVGRGGGKLEKALKEFALDVKGLTALDVGSSTGGFTDCLLQHGADKVYAVDVGYGSLTWKLRSDPRVVVIERTNIRYLTPEKLPGASHQPSVISHQSSVISHQSSVFSHQSSVFSHQSPEIAVIDVSFISLAKVLPAVYNLLAAKADAIALIKPQFEAGKEQVGKGGGIRDEAVRQAVVAKVKAEAETMALSRGL